MTIKELATWIGCSERTIRRQIEKQFPSLLKNGVETILDDEHCFGIAKEIKTVFLEPRQNAEVARQNAEVNPSLLIARALIEANKIIEEQQPKVEAYELFIAAGNTLDVGTVAKNLGTGRTRLFRYLHENHILMSNNVPYQYYIDNGYFVVKFKTIVMGEDSIEKPITRVTPKGQDFIRKIFIKPELKLVAST